MMRRPRFDAAPPALAAVAALLLAPHLALASAGSAPAFESH
jgi:hypothetical protein